jgi:tripartite-type tricarboxylate transporter receptor subunit TctC
MALAIGVLATATLSHAQSYPSSPIMLVNPYAAGGPADVLARPLASAMGTVWGSRSSS